jgi:protein ImuB
MVTAAQEANRRVIVSVDDAASRLNLRAGMTVAHAQSLVPNLVVHDSDPSDEEDALHKLGTWCIRYSPLVTPVVPDTVFVDVAGSAHLFKGEAALLKDALARLETAQVNARAAIADTPGCAWAVARYGKGGIVLQGRASDALGSLPVAALRLCEKTIESLRDVGIERIAQLASKPRASLQTRFGSEVLLRLDQALGAVCEPLVSILPPDVPRASMKFAEPIATAEDLQRVTSILCEQLVKDLEGRGVGVRRLDLVFLRVDSVTQGVRIGTSRANRDVKHLVKLLNERLVLVEPGFGIEEANLTASWVEALTPRQTIGVHIEGARPDIDVASLVDTLRIRLGPDRVYKLTPVESDIPERATKRSAPIQEGARIAWPANLPRPARLLSPPESVQAIAEIPDAAPRVFIWRKIRHRVTKADGPERILGEWWVSDKDIGMQRDYYRVENDEGERFWLFRDAPADEGGQWWLHGLGEA